MSKEVKVQLTVSYDKIRQVMCLMSGIVLQDSELEELIGNEIINLDTNVFGKSEEEFEQGISAMIIAQKVKKKKV